MCRDLTLQKSILLLAPNPFSSIETGLQRVHKKLISENPDKNFFFFVNEIEFKTQQFPNNCYPYKLEKFSAENIISRIKGLSFDIIDIPDFLLFRPKFRKQLKESKIKFKEIYLSMHGCPSKTEIKSLKVMAIEQMMKITSNKVYGLSPSYTKCIFKRRVHVIDPHHFKTTTKNENQRLEQNRIHGILFIGRMEIRKGILEFIEVAKKIESLGLKAEIIGPQSVNPNDKSVIESSLIFNEFKGGITFMQPEDLKSKLDLGGYIVIVCSKWESFSLVSMDAINSKNILIFNKNNGLYKSLKYKDLINIHEYKQSKNRDKEVENIVEIIFDLTTSSRKNQETEMIVQKNMLEWKYNFKQRVIKPSQLYDY